MMRWGRRLALASLVMCAGGVRADQIPIKAEANPAATADDPNAPWDPSEVADVGVDLYDSPLRNSAAPLRDVEQMRKELSKSKEWQSRVAGLDEATRELALDEHALRAAELPRWFMREELRSVDHIHPNEHGHRLIAELACPKLPASWGCECPTP